LIFPFFFLIFNWEIIIFKIIKLESISRIIKEETIRSLQCYKIDLNFKLRKIFKIKMGKLKKGKKSKKKKAKEPFVSKYAPVDYEKLMFIPKTKLTIKLKSLKSENSTFEAFIGENNTVSRIKEVINEKHGGACSNIRLFMTLNEKNFTLENDLNKQLKEVGLVGECNVLYEFDPIIHPLWK